MISHAPRSSLVLTTGLLVLAALIILSLMVGSRMISPMDALNGLFSPGSGTASIIVWQLRIPRTLAAIAVGVALAVAGILMQSLTRNPLAEPGLLGVNSGAAVFVVSGIAALGITDANGQMWMALFGAGLAATTVFYIGATGKGESIARLLLAGIALNACLSAVTGIITMFNSRAFDSCRFWVVGGFEGRELSVVLTSTPLLLAGLILGFALIRPLGALALGQDAAAGLGVPVPLVQAGTLLSITLLCGTATAIAGPLSFVGLVVPHVLRLLVGVSLSRLLPLSVIGGPILVLTADIVGRVIAIPSEVEAGIVTAFIGAPLLLALVLRLDSAGAHRARKIKRISRSEGNDQ